MNVIVALLGLAVVSAIVSFGIGAFVCSRSIAVGGSIVITELLFLIFIHREIASSPDAPDLIGWPAQLAIFIFPVILVTSLTCVNLMARLKRGKTCPRGSLSQRASPGKPPL